MPRRARQRKKPTHDQRVTRLRIKPGEIVDVINDALLVCMTLHERVNALEGRAKRTIGFSTDCVAYQDVGDGEGADDYETGGA